MTVGADAFDELQAARMQGYAGSGRGTRLIVI